MMDYGSQGESSQGAEGAADSFGDQQRKRNGVTEWVVHEDLRDWDLP